MHLVRARQLSDPLLEGADPPHHAEELERIRAQAVTASEPSTCWTAPTIFASSGRRYSSIGWLYGIGRVERGHELDRRP